MAFLFGLVTFWFVMAGALFIKDSGKHKPIHEYLCWPVSTWLIW